MTWGEALGSSLSYASAIYVCHNSQCGPYSAQKVTINKISLCNGDEPIAKIGCSHHHKDTQSAFKCSSIVAGFACNLASLYLNALWSEG